MKTLTRHRELILKNLQCRHDHPTAKMVFDSILTKSQSISFATVYNSLEYLFEKGMIQKLNLDSEGCRYDANLENHGHLVCKSCGQITDISVHHSLESIDFEPSSFIPENIHVEILGTCKNCSSK